MPTNWKNPYLVELKTKGESKEPPITPNLPSNLNREEFAAMANKFRDGIKEISTSIQQFEKTVDSMTNLFKTFEKLGGVEKINQLVTFANQANGSTGTKNGESGPQVFANPLQGLRQVFGLLEKVDFNQINQFLSSPLITSLMGDDDVKKGKS